jgi:ETC complex I subunit conserved region
MKIWERERPLPFPFSFGGSITSAAVSLIHQSPGRTVASSGSIFPDGAHAIIYRPCRSATTSGTRRTREWKLRFERQNAPFIEPLMGWTGGDDPFATVELSFPSLESAISNARRQGLKYTVQGASKRTPEIRVVTRTTEAERANSSARRRRMQWVEHTLGPEVIRNGLGPGTDPAAIYEDPRQLLRQEQLSRD